MFMQQTYIRRAFVRKLGAEIKECLPGDLPGALSTGRFGLLLALSPRRPAD